MESRIKAACWSKPLAAFRAIVSKLSKATLLWLRFCSAIARIQSVVCTACSVVCRAKSVAPLAIAVPPCLVGLKPSRTLLIGGRFRPHGMSLLRTAPTSMLDNRLSKLWFRKLLKFLAWRSIYWAKVPDIEFPYQDVMTLQYLNLIAAFSHSESSLSVN